jgi:hypothetical protein
VLHIPTGVAHNIKAEGGELTLLDIPPFNKTRRSSILSSLPRYGASIVRGSMPWAQSQTRPMVSYRWIYGACSRLGTPSLAADSARGGGVSTERSVTGRPTPAAPDAYRRR